MSIDYNKPMPNKKEMLKGVCFAEPFEKVRVEYYDLLSKVNKQREFVGLIQDSKMRKRAMKEIESNEKKLSKMKDVLFGD